MPVISQLPVSEELYCLCRFSLQTNLSTSCAVLVATFLAFWTSTSWKDCSLELGSSIVLITCCEKSPTRPAAANTVVRFSLKLWYIVFDLLFNTLVIFLYLLKNGFPEKLSILKLFFLSLYFLFKNYFTFFLLVIFSNLMFWIDRSQEVAERVAQSPGCLDQVLAEISKISCSN